MNALQNESKILIDTTKKMTRETAITLNSFIAALSEQLLIDGLTRARPEDKRGADRWHESHRKSISAMLSGDKEIPLSWKWSWIGLLDHPYQLRAIGDLISITGSLYVPAPKGPSERSPQATNLPNVIKEFSEMMSSSKPAQDGFLSPEDHPGETREYMEELFDVLEAVVNEMFRVQQGTGIMSDKMLRHTLARCFGYSEGK